MITVVMPVYNGEKYLDETLQSILKQGDIISRIIIVNDGSTDGSEQMIIDWKKKEKKIDLINKKNGGVSEARNCGLQEVKSKYVWFFDSDDLMPEGTAEKIVQNWKKQERITVSGIVPITMKGIIYYLQNSLYLKSCGKKTGLRCLAGMSLLEIRCFGQNF